jgi:ABC-type amino acid transport substrate-binding protein
LSLIRAAGLLSALSLVLASCGGGSSPTPGAAAPSSSPAGASAAATASAAPAIGDLVKPGKLIIVTTGQFAPFSFLDESGKLQGYSIDIARELADRLGLELETPTVDFVAVLQGVSSGLYDMSDVGIWPTAERQKQFNWTVPLVSDGTIATVLAAREKELPALNAELTGLKGIRISAATGSAQAEWLIENEAKGGYTFVPNQGLPEGILSLQNRQTDMEAGDNLAVSYYIAKNPGSIATIGDPVLAHPLSAAMRLEAPQLFAAANAALGAMVADGTVGGFQTKWFGRLIPTPTDINQTGTFPLPPKP